MIPEDMQTVLTTQPLGLVFDIDGTLSPIAPTPDEARLYPGVASLLEQLKQHAHVAIMTGRAVENGAALVNVDGLTYIGTHGLEWADGLPSSHPVRLIPEAQPYVEPGKYLLDLAEQQLATLPGLIVQRKSVGGSLHYRLSPDPEQAKQKILSLLAEPARQLHMRLGEGKMVVEVLTPLAVNKGQALRRFVQRLGLRGVIFAGDDRTDLDAVLEIEHLRQEGLATFAIVVQHADTMPALLEHADSVVQGVGEMAQLLREINECL
jgi:trehalose 6-phosphate phosphatase